MNPQRVTLLIAMVLVGLSAGFFFAYAASVTLGLAQVDNITYVRTLRAINDTVTNPWFGVVFFGSVLALGAAVLANWSTNRSMRTLTGIALALYRASFAALAVAATARVPAARSVR